MKTPYPNPNMNRNRNRNLTLNRTLILTLLLYLSLSILAGASIAPVREEAQAESRQVVRMGPEHPFTLNCRVYKNSIGQHKKSEVKKR